MISVARISEFIEFRQLRDVWNALADEQILASWEWRNAWWHGYGAPHELYVLQVDDGNGQTIGIAPLYLDRSLTHGRTLKFLASGKACTDYQTILARHELRSEVAEAIATWLTRPNLTRTDGWDCLELDSVAENDLAVRSLVDKLVERGATVAEQTAEPCWQVQLPANWPAFLNLVSSNTRRKIRKLDQTYLDTQRATIRLANDHAEVDRYFDLLVDFHQRRWREVDVDGCFSKPEFGQFLRQAAHDLLRRQRLWLSLLTIDSQPAGVTLFLRDHDAGYLLYQCGMNPDQRDHQAGWLSNILNLKAMINAGSPRCDFLRGDERYKRELAATAKAQVNFRVAAPHRLGQFRHSLWSTQLWLRDWTKQVVGSFGNTSMLADS